jgi:hypothetical protein
MTAEALAIGLGALWLILAVYTAGLSQHCNILTRRVRRLEKYVDMPKNQPFPGELE